MRQAASRRRNWQVGRQITLLETTGGRDMGHGSTRRAWRAALTTLVATGAGVGMTATQAEGASLSLSAPAQVTAGQTGVTATLTVTGTGGPEFVCNGGGNPVPACFGAGITVSLSCAAVGGGGGCSTAAG